MKITRIELQKNNNNRFSLFSDDKYVGSASVENLAKYGYGEFEISDEEFQELMKKENVEKIFNRCLNYTSKALKTSKEVRDYLYRLKVAPSLHNDIITRLEKLGFIDDKKYLEMYLEEKFNYSTDGSIKIINKLYLKGFDKNDIVPYLHKYCELEKKNLIKVIETRIKSKGKDDKNKLIRYLLQKGYEYSLIKEVVGDYINEDF